MTSGRDNDFNNLGDDTNRLMIRNWAAFSAQLQMSVALGPRARVLSPIAYRESGLAVS